MYDETLTILENTDYIDEMFLIDGEETEDPFHFEVNEEMDIISIDRAAALIKEMADRIDSNGFTSIKQAATAAQTSIQNFLNQYEEMRGVDFNA